MSGALIIVNRTVAGSTSPISGTLNVNGGTANINTNITTVDTTNIAGTRTAIVSLNGGTLEMNTKNIGTSALPITFNVTKGTLDSLGELNGGGALTKGGGVADALFLTGVNTYTGPTNVNAGTMFVDGTHTGGGLYTVASAATLAGSGSTASLVTVAAGGFLDPGDNNIGTLGVGSATINGTLDIDVNDANSPNQVDLLNDSSGTLSIGSNSTVNFSVTGTLSAPAYIFATYGPSGLSGAFYEHAKRAR